MNKLILFAVCTVLSVAMSTSFGQTSPEYDSYKIIQKGIKLHDDKKYAEAIAEFKKVNKNDTNYVLSILELANSYIANKQDSLAVLACDKVLFLPSALAPAVLLYKANALDNLKKTEEAEKVYREGINKYPLNNSFYYDLGILKYNRKKYKEANDLFVQSIKYNPFDATTHFQMGNLAFLQGKVVPAMLAWSFYLTLDNSSDRAKLVIGRLEKLAQNEYQFDDSTKIESLSDDEDFSELEALVKSKVALTNKYKSKIDLNYTITKQLQLIIEKVRANDESNSFYMKFYAPIFEQINRKDYFEPFIYGILSGMNIDKVNSWFKKNKTLYSEYSAWFVNYIGENNTVYETMMNGKMVSVRHWYNDNGKILAAGNVNAQRSDMGYWNYYYPTSILKSEGAYNSASKRIGTWKFYYPSGLIKSLETYKNGEIEGVVQSFYENGSIKTDKIFKNSLFEGTQTSYYATGVKNVTADYIADKENGKEVYYYPNSKLKYDVKIINDVYEGDLIQYYDNGHIKQKAALKNGKINGIATDYFNLPEKAVMTTTNYVNGTTVGEYKSYYASGKLEEVGKYNKDGLKDGKWLNYYDTDTLFSEEEYSNGKNDGFSKYYDYKGNITSEYTYKNDILQEYKAFDEKGKIIFQNKKDGKRNYDLLMYYANGNKQKEGKIVNAKLDGEWIYYDLDGFITDRIFYVNGVKQGKSTSYFSNGQVKSETNYIDGETDGFYKQYFKNGKIEKEGPYVKDKSVGEWNYFGETGNRKSTLFFKDDELDGWQQYFAANGKPDFDEYIELGYVKKRVSYDSTGAILQETSFDKGTGNFELKFFNGKKYYTSTLKNDLVQGPATSYYPSGQVRVLQNYVDGNLEGEVKFYYPNGKLEWQNNFVYGRKHGKQTHYNEDGTVEEEIEYYYGKRVGKNITYYPNKQIKYSINYKNDDLEGERFIYDETGELVIKRFYHNGYLTGYTYNDKNGNLLPVIPVKSETAVIKAFFKNGAPSIEYTLKKGELEGKRTIYHPNGKIKTEETYLYGDQLGLEKDYYPSGKILAEENWNNDKQDGKSTYYYENGKIKSEENYINGTEDGIFKYYDSNGKLTKTYFYYNGYLIDEK